MKKIKIYTYLAVIFLISSQKILCVKSTFVRAGVTAKVLDRATGNLYVGLDSQSTDSLILAFPRYNGYGNPIANLVVPQSAFTTDKDIELLTLSTSRCSTKPLLVTVIKNPSDNLQNQTKIFAFSSNFARDGKYDDSPELKDASGTAITSGIIALAASKNYAYAIVKPNGSSSYFGEPEGGLAAVTITNNLNINGDIILTQTDAQMPAGIPRAKEIVPTTPELMIALDPSITVSSALLHYDDHLQRLYIAISQITTNTSDTVGVYPGARSVIVAQSATDGVVTFTNIAPDSAFTPGNTNQIVGVITNNGDYLTIGVQNIRTMHTSTGKSYLIINGGNAPGNTVPDQNEDITPNNLIFALPLVDNPNSSSIHGTLANYADPSFTSNAILPAQTLTSDNVQTKVGAGPLPLLSAPSTQKISDMVVVGDTVFISTKETKDTNTESGIFYSQAMFDEFGRIYWWTPWTKRAFPLYGSSSSGQANYVQINFFDVDAGNGKIWAIDGISTSTVYINNWDANSASQNPTDLLGVLNKDFKCGCFCHLDLDQSTMALGNPSPARYALFGGLEQVAFVRTSTSLSANSPYDYNNALTNIPYAQNVTQNFSLPENYLLTKLPPKSGCVKVLEYSRNSVGQTLEQNYFFAGTQTGLYVYSKKNNYGFTIDNTINNLNMAPFTQSYWQKMPTISGAVIDIVSSGNALYVLTFETSSAKPIKNTVYKINFANTTTAMFDLSNIKIIAQNATNSNLSDLSKAKMFYATQILTTTSNNNIYEQLLLATNNGLYRSNMFTGKGVCDANNQADSQWAPVSTQDTSVYTDIFSVDNTNTAYLSTFSTTAFATVWPLQVADKNNCLTFENNNIRQLSGSLSELMPTFDPENFDAQSFDCALCSDNPNFANFNCNSFGCAGSNCTNYTNCNSSNSGCYSCQNNCNCTSLDCANYINKNFTPLDPINYFWSDGARRFFIIKRASDPSWVNKLFVIPYDTQEWMVTNPKTQVLMDKALQNIKSFYWLGPIGVTGIILAGTNNGVVALE